MMFVGRFKASNHIEYNTTEENTNKYTKRGLIPCWKNTVELNSKTEADKNSAPVTTLMLSLILRC